MQGEYRLQVNLQKDRQDREVVCTLHPQRRQDCSCAGVETWSKGPVPTLNCLVTLLLS